MNDGNVKSEIQMAYLRRALHQYTSVMMMQRKTQNNLPRYISIFSPQSLSALTPSYVYIKE